ncbi:MAG: glycosyltransferase [Pirellulales bacterium]|nr:glycosyltransferase [Pirellulales bacterium]
MPAADLSQLTAIISTADRPKSLRRLVRSLRRGYPELRIFVADASCEPSRQQPGIESIRLPAGSGRSAGCNALLARVRTPYFLLLNDQCELSGETSLAPLHALVANNMLDVAAGDLVGCQRKFWLLVKRGPQSEHGLMEISGDQITFTRGYRSRGEGFYWCDFVGNFFVARTEKVRALGGWDEELGNDERAEFFVRAQRRGLRVGVVPEVSVWLWNDRSKTPVADSVRDCKRLAVAKMRLARMIDCDGRILKAPRRPAVA